MPDKLLLAAIAAGVFIMLIVLFIVMKGRKEKLLSARHEAVNAAAEASKISKDTDSLVSNAKSMEAINALKKMRSAAEEAARWEEAANNTDSPGDAQNAATKAVQSASIVKTESEVAISRAPAKLQNT